MNTQINPEHISTIRLINKRKSEFIYYVPEKECKRISFSLKKLIHLKTYIKPGKFKDHIGSNYTWSELEDEYILSNNILYVKPQVLIYITGQEKPYVMKFCNDEEAEKYYNNISSLMKSTKTNKKSSKKSNKIIEL